jgi:hypothetical protein
LQHHCIAHEGQQADGTQEVHLKGMFKPRKTRTTRKELQGNTDIPVCVCLAKTTDKNVCVTLFFISVWSVFSVVNNQVCLTRMLT